MICFVFIHFCCCCYSCVDAYLCEQIIFTINNVVILATVIGAHGGSYSIYRAISVASGVLDPEYVPNYANTEPAVKIGPFPTWGTDKIVTIDCFGALVTRCF
ncbi:MAG: hypothetical protein ACK44D_12080, partial [Bacteroidia bacterium]